MLRGDSGYLACRQIATVLLRNGSVKAGDYLVAGEAFAKVKSLVDDAGKRKPESREETRRHY